MAFFFPLSSCPDTSGRWRLLARYLPAGTTLVRLVCWAVVAVLAVLGGYSEQAQQHQRQHMQQHQLLQNWSQQLTLRMEPYQRTLLQLAQHAPDAVAPSTASAVAPWFDALYWVPVAGAAQEHYPRAHTLSEGQSLPQAFIGSAADGGAPTPQLRAHNAAAAVDLVWTQPVRDIQGTLIGQWVAHSQVPQGWLLPAASVGYQAAVQFAVHDHAGDLLAASSPLADSLAGGGQVQALALPQLGWRLMAVAAPFSVLDGGQGLWYALLLVAVVGVVVTGWPRARALSSVPHVQADGEDGLGAPVAQVQLAQFSVFLRASTQAAWLLHGSVIARANQHACTLLGYAPEFLERMPVHYLLMQPTTTDWLQIALQQVRDHGEYQGVVHLRKADGQGVQALLLAYKLPDTVGDVVWQLTSLAAQLPVSAASAVAPGLVPQQTLLYWLEDWRQQCTHAQPTDALTPQEGSLLFIDMDCLGALNESIGRGFGDFVLQTIGHMLEQLVRPVGRAAWLGGDKFAALLPAVGTAHALLIAERLCKQVQDWRPLWRGEQHWVSVSVGVAAWQPCAHDAAAVLRAADMACYAAKRKGKAQVALGQVEGGG